MLSLILLSSSHLLSSSQAHLKLTDPQAHLKLTDPHLTDPQAHLKLTDHISPETQALKLTLSTPVS